MEELKRVEEMLCSDDDELIKLAFVILRNNYKLAKFIFEKYYILDSIIGDGLYYIELFDGPRRNSFSRFDSEVIYPKIGEDNNTLQFSVTNYIGFYAVRKLTINERNAQKMEKDI